MYERIRKRDTEQRQRQQQRLILHTITQTQSEGAKKQLRRHKNFTTTDGQSRIQHIAEKRRQQKLSRGVKQNTDKL